MTRRFARVVPVRLGKPLSRALDLVALKMTRIEMGNRAEADVTRVADKSPNLPIGVVFVNAEDQSRWIGDDLSLRPHPPSVRGCWPTVHGLEPRRMVLAAISG